MNLKEKWISGRQSDIAQLDARLKENLLNVASFFEALADRFPNHSCLVDVPAIIPRFSKNASKASNATTVILTTETTSNSTLNGSFSKNEFKTLKIPPHVYEDFEKGSIASKDNAEIVRDGQLLQSPHYKAVSSTISFPPNSQSVSSINNIDASNLEVTDSIIDPLVGPFTYSQLDTASNQVAHWAHSQWRCNKTLGPFLSKIHSSSFSKTLSTPAFVIGLLMENSSRYIALWLGLVKAGFIVAFLNTHIRGLPLFNAIKVAQCTSLIVSSTLAETARSMYSHFTHFVSKMGVQGFTNHRAANQSVTSFLVYIYNLDGISPPPLTGSLPTCIEEIPFCTLPRSTPGTSTPTSAMETSSVSILPTSLTALKGESSPLSFTTSFQNAISIPANSAFLPSDIPSTTSDKLASTDFCTLTTPLSPLKPPCSLAWVTYFPTQRISSNIREGHGWETPCFLIYTSGTTGHPKASRFSHKRVLGAGITWSRHMQLTQADRIYVPLPLFHGNGGVVAVSAAWTVGASLAIRRTFSASAFFKDCRQHNCTATFYVGELWLYLLAFTDSLSEEEQLMESRQHKLRVIAGNGLKARTWERVQQRFGIPSIVEHYGQTEMPAAFAMINSYGKPGACGYIPHAWSGHQENECLIAFDVETNLPIRDPDTGFCQPAPWIASIGRWEGEAIVRIESTYQGYTDPSATESVLYKDVFKKGDVWYHSGDILQRDIEGFFYFVDRTGDTYRRKGENISTTEVSESLAHHPLIHEANVYGVVLPYGDTTEKVGMASVAWAGQGDLEEFLASLHSYLYQELPLYAHPVFLRIKQKKQENAKTSTLKYVKHTAVKEGFDPRQACFNPDHPDHDLLYFNNPETASFMPLTLALYERVCKGHYKL